MTGSSSPEANFGLILRNKMNQRTHTFESIDGAFIIF